MGTRSQKFTANHLAKLRDGICRYKKLDENICTYNLFDAQMLKYTREIVHFGEIFCQKLSFKVVLTYAQTNFHQVYLTNLKQISKYFTTFRL